MKAIQTKMKPKQFIRMFVALLAFAVFSFPARAASEATDVRAAMERAFTQLRTGDYRALYDALPMASRQRISREGFMNGLQRARDSYGMELERLDIGAVHVGRDVAVVETVMYGRVRQPIEGAGKVVARQYLVREDGQWRVAVGARSVVQPLLAREPKFARQYPLREPRIYLERDGRWIDLGALRRRITTR
jgi:hypothetical protein